MNAVEVDEWAAEHYPPAHVVTSFVVRGSHSRAECSCGWAGPTRLGDDPYYGALLVDDMTEHAHREGLPCGLSACVACYPYPDEVAR